MDTRIPPLNIQIVPESIPPKSRILAQQTGRPQAFGRLSQLGHSVVAQLLAARWRAWEPYAKNVLGTTQGTPAPTPNNCYIQVYQVCFCDGPLF